MIIQKLALHNFRIYPRYILELSPKLNVIEGPNATGKTTVLEAIYLCALGKSFRTHQLSDLIHTDAPGFNVEITYTKSEVEQHAKVCGSAKERYVITNNVRQPLSSLVGGLNAVISIPDDIQLVKGAPAFRRDFLDCQILQIDPLYNHHYKRFQRALQQRNALLKQAMAATFDSWEYELAHSAAYLALHRKITVDRLVSHFQKAYEALSGKMEKLSLSYKSSVSIPREEWDLPLLRNYYIQTYKAQRARDMAVGTTLSGPHKDDLVLTLNERELRHFGSEGEQRSAAIALKLAEYTHITEANHGDQPLLMIDDIGYGLDSNRQQNLLNYLKGSGQVLITTTNKAMLD